MMMRLQHKRPDGELDIYHLKPGRRYHLGRGSSCEIRILDLKLSRKHCVIEFSDGAWRIEDLCSTNGCLVDGQQIVGNAALRTGTRIEAGTTALAVAALLAPDGDEPAGASSGEHAIEPAPVPVQTPVAPVPAASAAPAPAVEAPVVQQETMPEDGVEDRSAAPTLGESDWDPEPASASLTRTGALQPIPRDKPAQAEPAARVDETDPAISAVIRPQTQIQHGPALTPRRPAPAPAPVKTPAAGAPPAELRQPRIKPVTIRVGRIDGAEEHSPLGEPTPGAAPVLVEPPAEPAAQAEPAAAATPAVEAAPAAEERTFFITVLGRRVGPLTRSAARDLKARELKGTLSQAEIETYPPA